jgi:hypothetical protein
LLIEPFCLHIKSLTLASKQMKSGSMKVRVLKMHR